MLPKLHIYTVVLLLVALLVAVVGWQNQQNRHLREKIQQQQAQLDVATHNLRVMQQRGQQMAEQIGQLQKQQTQNRHQLNQALQDNPDWGSQRLPEAIRKAIAK